MWYKFTTYPVMWIIMALLAAPRITAILHHEKIAQPFRKLLGVEHSGEDSDWWVYPDNFIGDLIQCYKCTSVWVGIIVTVILFLFPPILVPFALSITTIFVWDKT